MAIMEDGGADGGGTALAWGLPENLAGFGGQADNVGAGQLDVLPFAAKFADDDRAVLRAVGEVFALPDRLAGGGVEGHHRALAAAGGDEDEAVVHQRAFGVNPAAGSAAEILGQADPPDLQPGVSL